MVLPDVGSIVNHVFAQIPEEKQAKALEKNELYQRIQDGERPIWAPDYRSQGYSIVWRRDGLPKLFVKMGIKNPAHATRQGRKRVLTFDDVWVVPVQPAKGPMPLPPMNLKGAAWWDKMRETASVHSPYIACMGCKVMDGAQRMSDTIREMLTGTLSQKDSTILNLKDEELENALMTFHPTGGADSTIEHVVGPLGIVGLRRNNSNPTRPAHSPLFRTGYPSGDGGYGSAGGYGYGYPALSYGYGAGYPGGFLMGSADQAEIEESGLAEILGEEE